MTPVALLALLAAAIMDQVKPYASVIELYDTSRNRKAQ